MEPIIKLIRFIIYSNIFVSICSVALTHLTYIFLNLPKEKNPPILLLVFCATYFTYNIQRVIRLDYQSLIGKNIGVRLSWIVRNRSLLLSSSILISLIGYSTLFFISLTSLITIIPLAILSILYVTPFIPYKGKMLSLRRIPFIKIIIISLVWSFVTVFLPYVNEYGFSQLDNINFNLTLITRFLFIFAITLPFDIRDLKFDKVRSLKTIPSTIGIIPSVILSEALILIYASFIFIQYYIFNQFTLMQLIALMSSIALIIIILSLSIKRRPELFYSGVVEGTMLILHFGILVLEY